MTDFLFLGSKITADGDCRREIRRQFLLGKKAVTNLDSVLQSRDITLLTKVRIVKVFPVVIYGCESWTGQSTEELMPSNCGAGEESPLDRRRSNQSILRESNPGYSLEGLTLKLKLQYFGYLR